MHGTRGRYGDGHDRRCLVGAVLYLGRQHRLPRGPVMSLLEDAPGTGFARCPMRNSLPPSATVRKDSVLEESGFEPSVPRCAYTADSAAVV